MLVVSRDFPFCLKEGLLLSTLTATLNREEGVTQLPCWDPVIAAGSHPPLLCVGVQETGAGPGFTL